MAAFRPPLKFVESIYRPWLQDSFLLAIAYHVFQVSNIYIFPDPINSLFAPDKYFFWWFVAPLLGLLFFVH